MGARRLALFSGLLAASLLPVGDAPGSATAPCRLSQLSLAFGIDVSPATGQNPVALRLRNHGSAACVLHGYPVLSFVDARGTLPFTIRRGGDQMVTSSRPRRVVLRPGRTAFVLVNKYRCDLGELRVALRLRLGLSRDGGRLSLSLAGEYSYEYCGKGDPGSTVSTSPFEPTVAAALRRH